MSLYGEKPVPADEAATVQFPRYQPTARPTAATGPPGGGPGGGLADHGGLGPGGHSGPGDGSALPGPVRPRNRRTRRLVAIGVVAGLLLAAGGTAAYAYSGEVPRGTRVLGVDVGGRSRTDAAAALRDELARRAGQLGAPVPVRLGERTGQVTPDEVGLVVDVEATVAAVVDTDPHPVSRLFGNRDVPPVVTVDPQRLDAKLRQVLGKNSQRMTLPAITFTGTTPKVTRPKPGLDLDPQRSAQVVRDGWLSGQPVTVPLVETSPATTAEELDKLLAELARPAVAAPVTINTDRGTVTVSPTAIARSLVLTADATGRITPRVDPKKLRAALATQLAKVEVAPKDATYRIVSGRPQPVEGVTGRQVDLAKLAPELLGVLPRSDGRELTAELTSAPPEITKAELGKLGIKERVSTFTTHFTGGAGSSRSQNIMTIAREVDGTLVRPGATFSLNGHTGERSYAQGYRDAPVILDGKLVPGVGGGTSQFTTTLFNAIYYAGLEDVEHKPHSYWFSRYPAEIESTIFYPSLDFKFRNNTEYGVIIDTAYTSSSITVSIWSTRIWDSVKTEYSPRRNITRPKLIHLKPGPSCIPTNGIDGFTQDAWRVFRKDGREVRREKFTWTYLAEPRYVCGTPPA